MESRDPVFKYGATTGHTSGRYQKYKAECSVRHDKYLNMGTSGYMFIPHGKEGKNSRLPFGNKGDSGAAVFNAWGQVVELLFTGEKPKRSAGPGYALITPIEDVLADIKPLSKGNIADIRIASW